MYIVAKQLFPKWWFNGDLLWSKVAKQNLNKQNYIDKAQQLHSIQPHLVLFNPAEIESGDTLPKTNSLPLKIDGWNMKFPFGAEGLFSKDALVSGSVTGNIMIFTTRLYRVQNLLDKLSLTNVAHYLRNIQVQTTILVIEATCSQRHRLSHPLKLQNTKNTTPKKIIENAPTKTTVTGNKLCR